MSMRERNVSYMAGIPILLLGLALIVVTLFVFITGIQAESGPRIALAGALFVISLLILIGLFVVNPNEAKVLQLFGKYIGTGNEAGLRWANPFMTKRAVSVRIRNFETGRLKVNDNRGNPVELACVVVWRVVDTAEACFNVNDYVDFVHVQSEAALRNLATGYPYDAHADGEKSLSSHTAEISEGLKVEIQDRLEKAGVEVLEARISHLAYAAEIAAAMLRRQQASAVVAARQQIVEGAVGMVEQALTSLSEQKIVELDDERRVAMVSNLMVVLCSDRDPQPVINTGSLYQ